MMEDFLQEIGPSLWTLIGVVVSGLLGVITPSIKRWFDESKILKQLEKYHFLSDDAVNAVEELYHHLKGPEKYAKAKEFVIGALGKAGMQVTEEQLELFIHGALKRARVEWDKVGPTTVNIEEAPEEVEIKE